MHIKSPLFLFFKQSSKSKETEFCKRFKFWKKSKFSKIEFWRILKLCIKEKKKKKAWYVELLSKLRKTKCMYSCIWSFGFFEMVSRQKIIYFYSIIGSGTWIRNVEGTNINASAQGHWRSWYRLFLYISYSSIIGSFTPKGTNWNKNRAELN